MLPLPVFSEIWFGAQSQRAEAEYRLDNGSSYLTVCCDGVRVSIDLQETRCRIGWWS